MRVFLAVMVVLLILLLIIAVQNPGSTEVTLFSFTANAPLLLIILVSTGVGLLLGMAIMAPGSLRRATRLRKLDSEIRALEKRSAEAQVTETLSTSAAEETTRRPSPRSPAKGGATSESDAAGTSTAVSAPVRGDEGPVEKQI